MNSIVLHHWLALARRQTSELPPFYHSQNYDYSEDPNLNQEHHPHHHHHHHHHRNPHHCLHQKSLSFRELSLHLVTFLIHFITSCCACITRTTTTNSTTTLLCHQKLASPKRPCSITTTPSSVSLNTSCKSSPTMRQPLSSTSQQSDCKKCSQSSSSLTRPTRRRQRHPTKSLVFGILGLVLLLCLVDLAAACGPGRRLPSRHHHRRLTPLVFKQHIPNVSENTLGASGLSEGRVARNHSRFKELVPNYNADIIFRDDEGTGADRLMTQRLKEKLNTLAISVMNQWPGVKLRVTQSWHEGNQYAGESLHYEGRAVDITTNDRDRSKLGMLARLAVEAGFDWVYYESRVWIHCSVKSEKSESARNGGCFDETSVVYSRSGGPKPIKDVSVGEELLTMAADGLSYAYSPVLMFLDRDPSVERLYYHIETSSGAKITATASHLLFVAEGLNEDEEKDSISVSATTTTTTTQPQFAKDITLGQYLYTLRREGDQLVDRSTQSATLEKVVKISTSLGRGAYAPLTMTGNLVVNNITASCYAVINSQRLAHLSFAPVRWAHSFTELGDRLSRFLLHSSSSSSSSSSFTRRAANSNSASASVAESANSIASPMQENSSKGGTGVHWYARLLYGLFRHLIPSKWMFN